MARIATPLTRSAPTATRLNPSRSINVPPRMPIVKSGNVALAPTRPAFPALPVDSSTNHGRATIVSELPIIDNPVATTSAINGARFGRAVPSVITWDRNARSFVQNFGVHAVGWSLAADDGQRVLGRQRCHFVP